MGRRTRTQDRAAAKETGIAIKPLAEDTVGAKSTSQEE